MGSDFTGTRDTGLCYSPIMKRLTILLLFLCAVAPAQQKSLGDWMDAYIRKLAPDKHFRGNILAEQDGRVVLARSYGLAIEGWNIPNSPQTRFELASVSKQFTAAAIMQLADAGRLSVDDPITKYYKDAPQAWQGITIHQLLTHTSGLSNNKIEDFSKGIATPYTPDELIQTFRDRPLAFAPGTKWAYTNTEYYLLAWLIEHLSSETYGAYLAHHIFEPLKMTHSGFASTLAIVPEMADGYTFEGGHLRLKDYFDRSLEIGAGGIFTTTGDMMLWNKALDAPGFLSAHSLDLMFTAHPPGNYGYGWFVENSPRRKIYHEGGDPGFAAFEARYPDHHLLILILSNEDDTPVRDTADALAKHILDPGSL
jgi:CubicO group peptidase (beta-lactamase class C family)